MKRRGLIALAIGAAILPLAANAYAQPDEPVHRIGVLCPVDCATADIRTFRQALAALGYKDGANVAYEYRYAAGDLGRLPGLANDLAERRVDVIFTAFGTAAPLAAERATTTVPIVAGSAGDLVAAGLARSLDRPGGNVTGVTSLALELEGKRLEILKELVPTISRVGFFRDTTNPYSILATARQRTAAAQLGIALQEVQVHDPRDVDAGFATIAKDGVKALCIDGYIPLIVSRDRIVALAAAQRIATIYPFRDFVDAGGLISYGSSLDDNAKRAAADVAKILAGAKPGNLPVERSTRVEMVVNLKTAKALGITVPPSILAGADEVIE